MIPSQEALREAVALLTSAVGSLDEVDELAHRALDEIPAPDLVLGLVALGRSLSFTAARLSTILDRDLSDQEGIDLTDEAVRTSALAVLQIYGAKVAAED